MVKDPAKRPSATDVTKIPFVARHIQVRIFITFEKLKSSCMISRFYVVNLQVEFWYKVSFYQELH